MTEAGPEILMLESLNVTQLYINSQMALAWRSAAEGNRIIKLNR